MSLVNEKQLIAELKRSKELPDEGTCTYDFLAVDIEADQMSLVAYPSGLYGITSPGSNLSGSILRMGRYVTQLMIKVVTSPETEPINPVENIFLYIGLEHYDDVEHEHYTIKSSTFTYHYIVLRLDTYIDLYSPAAQYSDIWLKCTLADDRNQFIESFDLIVWYLSERLYGLKSDMSHIQVLEGTKTEAASKHECHIISASDQYYIISIPDINISSQRYMPGTALTMCVAGREILDSIVMHTYIYMADYFWNLYMDGIRPSDTYIIPFQTPEEHGSIPELTNVMFKCHWWPDTAT